MVIDLEKLKKDAEDSSTAHICEAIALITSEIYKRYK